VWASWSVPRYLEPPFSTETKALATGWATALTGTDATLAGWATALTGTDVTLAGWATALTGTDVTLAGWATALTGTDVTLAGWATALTSSLFKASGWALAAQDVTLVDAAWAIYRTVTAAFSAGWVVSIVGNSVKENILQNIDTTLQGITTGAGYDTDVAFVSRRPISIPSVRERPAVIFGQTSQTKTQVPVTAYTTQLVVPLILVMDDDKDGGDADITTFVKDVENALQVDHTRGGYAVDTVDEGETDYTSEEIGSLLVTVKNYRIHYRHQVLDAETKL